MRFNNIGLIAVLLILNSLTLFSQEIIKYSVIDKDIYTLTANLDKKQYGRAFVVNISDSKIQQMAIDQFGLRPKRCDKMRIEILDNDENGKGSLLAIGSIYPSFINRPIKYAFVYCFENETVICSTNSSDEDYFLERPIEIMSLFYKYAKKNGVREEVIKKGIQRVLNMSLQSCMYLEYGNNPEYKNYYMESGTYRFYEINHDYSLLYSFLQSHFVVGADSDYLMNTMLEYVDYYKSMSSLPKKITEKNILYELIELATYANMPSEAPRVTSENKLSHQNEDCKDDSITSNVTAEEEDTYLRDTVQYYVISKNIKEYICNLRQRESGRYLDVDISNSELQKHILQWRNRLQPIDCSALFLSRLDKKNVNQSNILAYGSVYSGSYAGRTSVINVFCFDGETVLCAKSVNFEHYFLDRPIQMIKLFYNYAKKNNLFDSAIKQVLYKLLSECLSDNIFYYHYFPPVEYEWFDTSPQEYKWYEIDHDYSILYSFLQSHFVVGADSDYLMNTMLEYIDYYKNRSSLPKKYMEKNILYEMIELATYANLPSVAPRVNSEMKISGNSGTSARNTEIKLPRR